MIARLTSPSLLLRHTIFSSRATCAHVHGYARLQCCHFHSLSSPPVVNPRRRFSERRRIAQKQSRCASDESSKKRVSFDPLNADADRLYNSLNSAAANSSPSKDDAGSGEKTPDDDEPKKSIFQRFKTLAKQYWYVLIPVHVATSILIYVLFYLAAKSGVDMAKLLTAMHVPDYVVEKIKHTGAGDFAITNALYKIVTPIRYAITVGGTTLLVRAPRARGLIKPMPSAKAMREKIRMR